MKYLVPLTIWALAFSPKTSYCQNSKKIDQYLKSVIKNHIIPGFAVTVLHKSEIIFSKGYGVEKLGEAKPFGPETVSSVGSLTKSFTALAVLKLVEKGKIELDKPVVFYIPWFRTANKDVSDHITVRMLLDNTSGLYINSSLPMFDISGNALEKLTRNLESTYLTREPGAAYEYSNVAFSVAGFLISKISGMSYPAYLEKEIFQPLEMSHTTTDPASLKHLHALEGHFYGIEAGIAVTNDHALLSGEYIPAGSLLNSSTADISHYLIALTNGGIYKGKRILSENSIKMMWKGEISFPGLSKEDGGDGSLFQYGLGWMISNVDGKVIIHHGGSTGKMSSFTMIDTSNQLSATILMNIDMTFINKYAFATEFNILNNVMRLADGKPISKFGIPTIKDITLNQFEIKEQLKSRYCGLYINKNGGGDLWVYYGVDLRIFKRPDGQLEGRVYRGDQIVNEFIIDFISESQAITRNIALAETIHFRLGPQGKVSGVFFKNIEFLLEDTNRQKRNYQKVNLPYSTIHFQLPDNWKPDQDQNGYSAESKDGKSKLWVLIDDKAMPDSPESSMQGLLNQYSVKTSGAEFKENLGKYTWKMKSFLLFDKDLIRQAELLQSVIGDSRISLLLITPQGELTNQIQQVLNPFLFSFSQEKDAEISN